MRSATLAFATKIHQKHCDRMSLARYYLKSELPNILAGVGSPLIDKNIDRLGDTQLLRLLRALSDTYRLNDVWRFITDEAMDWYEVDLPMDHVKLSGISPHIDKIMHSDEVGRDPLKFASYLRRYFDEHPSDDPIGLNEFRPDGRAIGLTTLVTRETEAGEIIMLDGSHRLVALALKGATLVRAFSAVPDGKPHRFRLGDAWFRELRILYESHTKPNEREHILAVTTMFATGSIDGEQAIRNYWTAHSRNPETKQAGQALIDRIKDSQG